MCVCVRTTHSSSFDVLVSVLYTWLANVENRHMGIWEQIYIFVCMCVKMLIQIEFGQDTFLRLHQRLLCILEHLKRATDRLQFVSGIGT